MIDLTGRTDVPVAEEVLAELTTICRSVDVGFLVVGAAARDLAIHAVQRSSPVRATEDIDIAVAVHSREGYSALMGRLGEEGARMSPHKVEILGVEVDVVPFGALERDRAVLFANDHRLDVNGLQEAHATSLQVRMPGGTGVRVASAPAQTALKILAWRDRHHVTAKDGRDLGTILTALSSDPFDDEVWDDEDALNATDADIITAACHHYGRIAAHPFSAIDGTAVLAVLSDASRRATLVRHMSSALADEQLDAYARGFAAGLT